MLTELILSMAVVAAAPEAPAVSVDDARARLAEQLTEHVHLRLGLGDGRGAATALAALAATAEDGSLVGETAFPVLDLWEQTGLPRDIRHRLISREEGVYEKARSELLAALKSLVAEHKLPDASRGWQILGPESGCPLRSARAFAGAPDGSVLLLADGIARHDGTRWQVMGPEAIRVHSPVSAMFVDRRGRTWLGSTGSRSGPRGLIGHLRRGGTGAVGYSEPGRGGLIAGRWHVFTGGDEITSFAEGKPGVWIGSRTRILLADGERLVPVNAPLPYSPARVLLASPEADDLWVIDADRLSHFDGTRWRSGRLGDRTPVGGCLTKAGPAVLLRSGLLLAAPGGGFTEVSVKGMKGMNGMTGVKGMNGMAGVKGMNGTTGVKGRPSHPSYPSYSSGMAGIAVGPDDTIWCVTSDGRVLRRSGGRWLIEDTPKGLRPATRPAIFCDRAGRVWLSRGRGIELCAGRPAAAQPASVSIRNLPALPEAPLVSAVGSGGWLRDPARFEPRSAEEEEEEGPAAGDLGGFAEDDGAEERGTPKALLAELRQSGRSVELFRRLMRALEKSPDPETRWLALGNGAISGNDAFLSDAALVGEFIHPGRITPVKCIQWLMIGWRGSRSDQGRAGAESALFELFTRFGFGEFARPALRNEREWREPKLSPDDFAAADLKPAAELVRKLQRVRAGFSGVPGLESWKTIVRPNTVPLAPYRWIRRLKIKTDAGLGPVAAKDGKVYLYDEGREALLSIDAAGNLLPPTNVGGSWLVQIPDVKAAPIDGLTDAVDGFSVTPGDDGIFYCFGGGLTKVDLKAHKVAWRNADIVGGANPWRSLLERSLPVPDGADVFVAAGSRLHCVDAATGKVRWSRDVTAPGAPAVVGDVVVTGAGRHEVRGLNRRTGKPVWKHLTRYGIDSGVVTDGERAFYSSDAGRVAALDAKTGEFLWSRPTDIALRPPASSRETPTALLPRNGKLVVCNRFGYIEFDAKSGAILRRLPVTTARPMVATPHGVVVMTAPNRLVCVADPGGADLAAKVLRLAGDVWKKDPKKALEMARLAATYIDAANLSAHALALELSVAAGQPTRTQDLYSQMLSSVDPFTPEARALMRKYLGYASTETSRARAELGLVARAHIERGDAREAAKVFAALGQLRKNPDGLGLLLGLQLAAEQKDAAMETVRALKTTVRGAYIALRALASEGMEEEALGVASVFAGNRDRLPLLYAAIDVSGVAGLFEEAKRMLDRSAAWLPGRDRAFAFSWLLSSSGVADRALTQYGRRLGKRVDDYRALLLQRRDALKALDRPDELKAVEAQLDRLKAVTFP